MGCLSSLILGATNLRLARCGGCLLGLSRALPMVGATKCVSGSNVCCG